MNEPAAPAPRNAMKWLLRLALGLVVLALLLSQRNVAADVGQVLGTVAIPLLLLAVLFYWMGQLLSAWKWNLLMRARGVQVSLRQCVRFYMAGMFGNLWLPTSVGGDSLRAYLVSQETPNLSLAEAAASVLVERLTGFLALLAIAGIGLTLTGLNNGQGLLLMVGGLGLVALVLLCWVVMKGLEHKSTHVLVQKLGRVRQQVSYYMDPELRAQLALALGLSLAFQLSQVLLNIYLAGIVGLDLPWLTFFWLCPLLALSGLLPIGIGGLGVREGAALALLSGSALVATEGHILGWSLLWQVTVWLSSLPGGLFLKARSKR